jgi:hypothetical protein
MWVMQPAVHKVVDVITVRHLFVSAARTMRMRAPGFGRAAQGVGIAHLDNMFVDMNPCLNFGREVPPAALPEWLADDVRPRKAAPLDAGAVSLDDFTFQVETAQIDPARRSP